MFHVCSTEELFLCLGRVGWHWTARCHAENIAGARRLVVIIVQANSFAALVEVTPHKHDKLSFACLAAFKICLNRWQQCVHEYRWSSIMSNKFAALVEVTSHKQDKPSIACVADEAKCTWVLIKQHCVHHCLWHTRWTTCSMVLVKTIISARLLRMKHDWVLEYHWMIPSGDRSQEWYHSQILDFVLET